MSATLRRVGFAAVNPVDKEYFEKNKQSKHPIELTIPVRFRGIYHPECVTCSHSIMSHGELDGQLVCWSCVKIKKVCMAGVIIDIRKIVKEIINGTEPISEANVKNSSVPGERNATRN